LPGTTNAPYTSDKHAPQKLTVIIERSQKEIKEGLKALMEMMEKAKKGMRKKKAEGEQNELDILH
jgi:hypothetical protein